LGQRFAAVCIIAMNVCRCLSSLSLWDEASESEEYGRENGEFLPHLGNDF